MKLKIDRLEEDESLRAFRYHIRGIVEAAENVAGLMQRMNRSYQRDVDDYAEASSLLEVEALDHLGYHVKQLRTPLRRLQRDAYAELDSKKPAKAVQRNQKRASRSAKGKKQRK